MLRPAVIASHKSAAAFNSTKSLVQTEWLSNKTAADDAATARAPPQERQMRRSPGTNSGAVETETAQLCLCSDRSGSSEQTRHRGD